LIFPLLDYPSLTPVLTLGGRLSRPKPVVPLLVTGPGSTALTDVLLDSGADDVVFPTRLAARVGVSLQGSPQAQFLGAGNAQPSPVFYAPVILELRRHQASCRWRAIVGFTPAPMRWALFGVAGGLEHFQTTLDFHTREIILVPHPSLPSTADPAP
jgi:hypothetical protein